MKEITDYTEQTADSEIFSFIYDRLISREITAFSELLEFTAPILKYKRVPPVIMRGFELIKQLNWGFFSNISLSTHRKLWRELVIPDEQFPAAGDLKRTISISNLYICMLDIHGYTKFCQESRKNLSMLHTLDKTINHEIQDISAKCGSVSQRERGDEIVVVSATASDALTVTLSIIDYFAKTNIVDDPGIPTKRTGDSTILPNFKLSAGITGGNTSVPLIITEKGMISGFLLNSGARLQMRANELSPKDSRVMITKQVYMSFQKENTTEKCSLVRRNTVCFLDTGSIEFRGVQLPSCEAIFRKEERYKQKFNEVLVRLYGSIRENMWEQRIFTDLMDVHIEVMIQMPRFSVTPPVPVKNMKTLTNESFIEFCQSAVKSYVLYEDYPAAVAMLHTMIPILEAIPGFERLILDYHRGVAEKYSFLLESYKNFIDREIEEKAANIFHGDNYKTWLAAKNGAAIYEKLRTIGRRSNELTKKKNLWHTLVKQHHDKMVFTLYSGKK